MLQCNHGTIDLFFTIMQLKRLKLRKNNWSSESYRFDELLTESASQKRVYEAVAKPVVEVTWKPVYYVLTSCTL